MQNKEVDGILNTCVNENKILKTKPEKLFEKEGMIMSNKLEVIENQWMQRGLKIFKKYGAGKKPFSEIAKSLDLIIHGNIWNAVQFFKVIELENEGEESGEDCVQPEEEFCEHSEDFYDPKREKELAASLFLMF